MQVVIARLLRAGVLLAILFVGAGGGYFLARHGFEHPDYHTFRGEPAALRDPASLLGFPASLRDLCLMQTGVLLLIATPVARVAFSVYAFAREGDRRYVAITLTVLALLAYSLFGRH